jgi:dCTP diphosphatase
MRHATGCVKNPCTLVSPKRMADVLVYLVGLADQCGVDLGPATLAKIDTSADKYPTDKNRGIAPEKV